MKSTTLIQRESSTGAGGSETSQGGILDLHVAPDNARLEQQRDQERHDVKSAVPGFVWTEFSEEDADTANHAMTTARAIHKRTE